jgi:hypothetical protein
VNLDLELDRLALDGILQVGTRAAVPAKSSVSLGLPVSESGVPDEVERPLVSVVPVGSKLW